MAIVLPGTDIEVGKWYSATQRPPILKGKASEEEEDEFDLILGIKDVGARPGFYVPEEDQYYWHCERYDSFDDEPVPGWTREQEINNNLEPTYEKARGVVCWLIIPNFDNDLPSIDGKTGYSPDPDQDWSVGEDEDLDDEELEDDEEDTTQPRNAFAAGMIIPLHDN